jgi:Ring finger domain
MDLVAQEIETVIYGESDDENNDDELQFSSCYKMEEDDIVDGRCGVGNKSDNRVISTRRRSGQDRRKENHSTIVTRTVTFCDDEINRYGLFDDLYHHHQRACTKLKGAPSSCSIIYTKKYQSPGALFAPFLGFLSAMFVILLVIRVIMSLLSAVVGTVALLLLAGSVVHEFLTQPVRLIRNLHTSPVLCFGVLGAMLGAIHGLLVEHLFPLSMTLMDSCTFQMLSGYGHGIEDCFQVDAAATSYKGDTINTDLIMLWGLIHGLGYGIEIGYVWFILFGKSSKSTALSRYIYRQVWQPLKRQYKSSAVLMEQSKHPLVSMEHRVRNIDYQGEATGENCHYCSICLENLDDSVNSETNHERDSPPPDRYQMLPCHHCFHRDCARHWLTIQQTCPVCRIQVEGMRGCAYSERTCPVV